MDVKKLIQEKGHLIDEEIKKVIPLEGVKNLNDAVWYHLGTGGKRIRPALAIITCEALGCEKEKIIPFAAACEILHNWLLIHDDIEDGDKVRRNNPAVWVKYGLPHGINIGDYMSMKVFELVLNSREKGVDNETVLKLLKHMILTSIRTAEGQAMDINLRQNDSPTEEEYMEMVIGKTAHYLTAPMVGGAIVAGREDLVEKILDFGRKIGPAFQITDDILDLTEGKGRSEIGRDIKEGKRSILVAHCLSKCNEDERQMLIEILNKPVDDTTNEDVEKVKQLFEKYGSVDYARNKAQKLVDEAKNIIADFPAELKEILDFVADYLIKRKK